MAKKRVEKEEPEISSIPIPPSDSALVIDLPDGQKLLVGKIDSGTVIEVATWRGTGRPDSRTNRLMLGMSNESQINARAGSGDNSDQNEKDSEKNPKSLINRFKAILKTIIKKLSPLVFKIKIVALKSTGKLKTRISKAQNSSIESPTWQPTRTTDDEFDIDFQKIIDEVNNRRDSRKSEPKKVERKHPETSGVKKKAAANTQKKRPAKRK